MKKLTLISLILLSGCATGNSTANNINSLRMGMSQQEVMRTLGMTGFPIDASITQIGSDRYEHWTVCWDWLNGWNLSRVMCPYDNLWGRYRLMFVNDKLESFSD